MKRIVRFCVVILFGVLCVGVSVIAEEITLTTYYPAPYGAYDELTTTDNTNLATDSGSVGVGTTVPGSKLSVSGGVSIGSAYVADTAPTNGMIIEGSVGIGTDSPTVKLHVVGTITATGDANVSRIYTQAATTAHGIGHNFNDIAEYINVRLEDGLEAGDVVSIDTEIDGTVRRSSKDYDLAVAGIVSSEDTAAFIIGKDKEAGLNKKLLALAGRVFGKVTTINGPIKRGDLLTTSSIPGHAMKATDREKSFGAIVGKALEPFDGGPEGERTGEILILVTLQ